MSPKQSWMAGSGRKDMETQTSKGDASQLDDETLRSRD